MVIHVVAIQTDEHGQGSILSHRTDSSNLATFAFSDLSGRSWTDRHRSFHWTGIMARHADGLSYYCRHHVDDHLLGRTFTRRPEQGREIARESKTRGFSVGLPYGGIIVCQRSE